ncbi:MAG: hypothetical protein FJY86_04445 [Candidatus Diapherotrites archaeon]|uniref:Uncharacterized protein n=1 Tax=Candidatus Iainarchaeum sp. TaxID=3101447 RepID=A0A8T4C8A9_9ARCH|nr:hypothetical protein [Candidatus Diapherotrites archaeon]
MNQLREAGLVRPTRKVKDGIHTAVGIGLTRAGEVRMSALRLVNLPRLKNVPQNERMKMIVPVVLDIMHEIRLAELERMILQTVHDPSRAAKVKTTRYIPPVSKEMVLDALIKYSVHDEADRRRSLQKGRADDFHSTVLESMRFLQARLDVVGEALKIVDSPTLYRQLEGKSIDIWYDAQYWRGRERMNDRIAEWMRRKK